jgi:hypothetical protein
MMRCEGREVDEIRSSAYGAITQPARQHAFLDIASLSAHDSGYYPDPILAE